MIVVQTRSNTCSVAMLERYYEMASITKESGLQLFLCIVSTARGERCRNPLVILGLRKLFFQKLSSLGFDAKQFGLHSLRSGGANSSSPNSVPDRLFK